MKIQNDYNTSCETRDGCPDVILYDVAFPFGSSKDMELSRQYRQEL